MKFYSNSKTYLLIFITAILFQNGCERENRSEQLSYPLETAKIVSEVTSGVIYPESAIRIRFVVPLITEDQIGSELSKGILTFNPGIPGISNWEDTQTLKFQPDGPLPMRQMYNAILNITALLPEYKKEKIEPIEWYFKTSGRELESFEGDFYLQEEDDPKKLFYKGQIYFTQPVELQQVREAAIFRLNQKIIDLNWEGDKDEKKYIFQSPLIIRDETPKEFIFSLNKKQLDLSNDFEKKFYLQPLKNFTIQNIITEDTGEEPALKFEFSDELAKNQDISGLIHIESIGDVQLKKSGKFVYTKGDFEYGQTYTIKFSRGIRSKWGTKIEEDILKVWSIPDLKPQMRFASDGIFLPSTNQQKILFQTVNLRNVIVEILQVFENNIGQFLQTEQLYSIKSRNRDFNRWEMNRVGVLILKDTLTIGEIKNNWLLHELDLQKLMPAKEKGFYLIKINFRREDMIYSGLEPISQDSYGRYWGNLWYSDPNSPGYLYQNGQIYKPIILSDIGLTYKQGEEQHLLFVSDLKNGKPLSGVKVSLRNYQNQILASQVSRGDGIVSFQGITDEVFYVEAIKGNHRSIIKLNEMSWNISGFDVGGVEPPKKGIRAFIYTERGVFRPGDTLHISLIARNQENTFPENHPVTLKIFNPNNQVIYTTTKKVAKDGFYSFEFPTHPDDKTGNWRAEFLVGTQKFLHTLKIETIVPHRLKVKIETNKTNLTPTDKNIQLKLIAEYLFGQPAAGLDGEVSVTIQNYPKSINRYKNYSFEHEGLKFSEIKTTLFKNKLNTTGIAQIFWQLPSFENATSALQAIFQAKVYDKGGRSTTEEINIPIDPYDFYVGIEQPQSEYEYTEVGSPIHFNTILVNSLGELVPGKNLVYRIYRQNKSWWWEYDNQKDFRLKFKSDSNTELVKEGSLISGSGPVFLTFNPEDFGEYMLEIGDATRNGHTAAIFFSAYFWGKTPEAGDAGILTLKSDKKKYYPGETAQVSFPAPEKSTVLLTVEKYREILSQQWIQAGTGGEGIQVEIPVSKEMLPNAYISVSVIQPHDQTLNDRPLRMYGIIPLLVEKPDSRQGLVITMPDELRPNQSFEVEVQTTDRKPTQLTVTVVDEGLLSLTHFKTPNPWEEFYRKYRLAVNTFDLFSYVLAANKGDIFRIFSLGGGIPLSDMYRLDQQEAQKAKRFKPVCMFKGPILTDNQGKIKTTFFMPEYLGAVRVMVASAKEDRYGFSDKLVPVKTELMVLPILPRVLGPGDKINIPITIFTMKDEVGDVDVKIDTEGPLRIVGESSKKINIPTSGETDIFFELLADQAVGISKINVEAKSIQFNTSTSTELDIRASSPRMFDSQEITCSPGESITINVPNRGLPGTNQCTVNIMRKPKLNLLNRLRWLMNYPYGCIEQTISAVFPQLYLKEFITEQQAEWTEMDRNINAAISKLGKFQLTSGGFSYWPGRNETSAWGTNYAGHFLLEAQKLGYYVPAELYENWLRYQRSVALTTRDNLLVRLYRIFLLALAGESHWGAMNLLKENSFAEMNDTEKWLLASTYHLAGEKEIAQNLSQNAGFSVADSLELSGTYGSLLRNKAMILESLIILERWSDANRIYLDLTEHLSRNDWYSTQTIGYSLLALGKYIRINAPDFLEENGIMAGNIVLPDGNKVFFETNQIKYSLPISQGFGENLTVNIDEKTKLKSVYVLLEWNGVPLIPANKKLSKNLELTVEWLDEDGININPSELTQGSTFWGHFKISKAPGLIHSLEELALVQIFPAGWEIENTRLSGEQTPGWVKNMKLNNEKYLDIRDDRIMWFFDLPQGPNKSFDFLVKLNAITIGEYILPPTLFEAMYDNRYQAIEPGFPVRIINRN